MSSREQPAWQEEQQDWGLLQPWPHWPSRHAAEVATAKLRRPRSPAPAAEAEESGANDPPPTPPRPENRRLEARGSAADTIRRECRPPGRLSVQHQPPPAARSSTSRPALSAVRRPAEQTEAEVSETAGEGVWREQKVRSPATPGSPGSPRPTTPGSPSLSGQSRSRSRSEGSPRFPIGTTIAFVWASWYTDARPPEAVSNKKKGLERPYRCGEPTSGSENSNVRNHTHIAPSQTPRAECWNHRPAV